MPAAGRWFAVLSCLVLCSGVLWFDLEMPLGVSAGALYCAAVLNTIWARDVRVTVGFTVLCTALIGVGMRFSEPAGAEWVFHTNRTISIGLVWLAGAIVVSRLMTSARFRSALNAAPAGMFVVGRAGRILFANHAAERVHGTVDGGLIGLSLDALVSQPTVDLVSSMARQRPGRAASMLRHVGQAEGRRLDGSTFPAECDVMGLRREVGNMQLVTIRDRTEELRGQTANERLAAIVRSSRDAILAKDLQGRITDWNPGAERIYGYTAEEVLGQHISLLVPPSRHAEIDQVLRAVGAGEDLVLKTQRLTKAGRIIDVDLSASAIRDGSGRVIGVSVSARDVSAERAAERRLVELNAALSHAMPGVIEVGSARLVIEMNAEAAQLSARSPGELLGRSWLDLIAVDDREEAEAALEAMHQDGNSSVTIRVAGVEGRFVELFLVQAADPRNGQGAFHVFMRDVTRRAQSEAHARKLAEELASANRVLERQANVDPLTGILNRRGLERRIHRLRLGARNPIAVVLADVDDFKGVNEEHGHATGDRVLLQIAESLEDAARVSDPVARIGGDEFLVLLPNTDLEEAGRVAERMRASVAEAGHEDPLGPPPVTCSIGVAVLEASELTIEAALTAARNQLARSKHEGKDRVCLPERAPLHGSADDAHVSAVRAVEDLALRAFHQPIYDLVENRVTAFELLIRGPEGPLERPRELLSSIRPGDELIKLDLRCLSVCIESARSLPLNTCLHVNLLPATLVAVGADAVLERLRRAGPNRAFCLELDERKMPANSDVLLEQVHALKRAGVQVAIDDVGLGSTPLEALLRLEPDVIKIDSACTASKDGDRVLGRLLAVTGALRTRVIAEGLEDEETRRRLLGHRVRFGQGYLLGRPEPIAEQAEDVLLPQVQRDRAHDGARRGSPASSANGTATAADS